MNINDYFTFTFTGKGYNIGEIDITEGYSLSNELLVSRIPTLYHVKNGEFR